MLAPATGACRDIRANMERTSLPKGLDHYGPEDERNSRQPCPEPGRAAVTVGDPCWQWISSGMGTRPRACEEVSWLGRTQCPCCAAGPRTVACADFLGYREPAVANLVGSPAVCQCSGGARRPDLPRQSSRGGHQPARGVATRRTERRRHFQLAPGPAPPLSPEPEDQLVRPPRVVRCFHSRALEPGAGPRKVSAGYIRGPPQLMGFQNSATSPDLASMRPYSARIVRRCRSPKMSVLSVTSVRAVSPNLSA